MYITKVIIDSREQDRIEKLQVMYRKFNPAASITVEELVTGDICFFTNDSDKPILTCEIKEKNDYIDSMISGHLFHQCDRLIDETNPFLCIIGKQDFSNYHDLNKNAYYGSMGSILAKGIRIIQLRSSREAFITLFYAAEKCAQFKDYIPKWNNIRKEVRNPAKVYLLGIPGVSGTRANWICKELHLMGLSSLLGLTKEKLMSVKGIGNNTANTILKYL